MRRLLGLVVLVVLMAVSLWSLQRSDHDAASPGGNPAAPAGAAPAGSLEPLRPAAAPKGSTISPRRPLPSAPASSAGATVSAPARGGGEVHASGGQVVATAAAVARDSRQAARFAAYEKVAVAFLSDFARPPASVPAAQWWGAVKPHLAARVVADYASTDPQQVPFTVVTGPGVVIPADAPSDLLMVARVPTDAGVYLVEMETDEGGIHVTRATREASTRR